MTETDLETSNAYKRICTDWHYILFKNPQFDFNSVTAETKSWGRIIKLPVPNKYLPEAMVADTGSTFLHDNIDSQFANCTQLANSISL